MSKVKLNLFTNKLTQIWIALSVREKLLAVMSVIISIGIGLYYIYEPISSALAKQELILNQTRSDLKNLALDLEKYAKLSARKKQIQQTYEGIDLQEGALSNIEELIKTKAEVTDKRNFRINPLPEKAFGVNSVQEPFKIELKVTSMQKLVAFLNELVNGSRPLVLTRLDIKKSARGDFLNVEMDVSNIKQAKSDKS